VKRGLRRRILGKFHCGEFRTSSQANDRSIIQSMSEHGYLGIIECGQKQAYIFNTNKLRVQISGSENIFRVGTEWFLAAVDEVLETSLCPKGVFDLNAAHTAINEETDKKADSTVKVLCATSGLAIFWVKDREQAKAICAKVSRKAFDDAPGLEVTVYQHKCSHNDPFDDMADAFSGLTKVRNLLPSQVNRFVQLPFVAQCQIGSLPASGFKQAGETKYRVSHEVAKRWEDGRKHFWKRLVKSNIDLELLTAYSDSLDTSDEEVSDWNARWIAVVHIDGNGFGALMQSATMSDVYVPLSQGIDKCSLSAFAESVRKVYPEWLDEGEHSKRLLPVPILVAGDDVTFVISGTNAFEFTETFMREFYNATMRELAQPMGLLNKVGGLTSAAGICFIKPKYPFHAAADMAEELCKSAKNKLRSQEKGDTHFGLDFHFMYDSTPLGVDDARSNLRVREYEFTKRPFVFPVDGEEGEWKLFLERCQKWMSNTDSVKKQAFYEVREALDEAPEIAVCLYDLVVRDKESPFFGPKLFDEDRKTMLVDVIEASEVFTAKQNQAAQVTG
jgi:hypothetical protein